MNENMVYKSATELLRPEWLDISEAPNQLLKCIVMYEERFPSGNPYMAIGWIHDNGTFAPDSHMHKSLTPTHFIPLYHENQPK